MHRVNDGQAQTFGGDEDSEVAGAIFACCEKGGLGGMRGDCDAPDAGERRIPLRGVVVRMVGHHPRTGEGGPQLSCGGSRW